jgi:hypothetical protein
MGDAAAQLLDEQGVEFMDEFMDDNGAGDRAASLTTMEIA